MGILYMERTKQTARARVTRGKPAGFLRGDEPTPLTSGDSEALIPGDQGGKAPHGQAPTKRQVGQRTGRIPPTLRIARENATCRITGAM